MSYLDELRQQHTADHYDEAAWGRFLIANGSFWDGTQASWARYRDRFAGTAAAHGFGPPVAGLLTYLEAQAVPDRIATLAAYGVIIAEAARPAAAPDAPRGPSSGRDEFARSLMAELLASHPELAAIPENRRWELLTGVLSRR